MLATPIEKFLVDTGANLLTEWFLMVIGATLIVCVVLRLLNLMHGITSYAPTLLTTIGILGTFAGIVSGLLGFEVENIDDSIATLLDGLKTAFITSLAGMVASIFYKVLAASGFLSIFHRSSVNEEAVGAAEILTALQEQKLALDSLSSAVGGDSETSLVGQIKLMRSDNSDNNKQLKLELAASNESLNLIQQTASKQEEQFKSFEDRLWIKLQDFADMMSKSATEQVINALKEVISDFNNNLTEQFGDNFKKLNEAVLELVKWQENYKLQLETMIDQYKLGLESISCTEQSVKAISEESQVIPKSMNELKDVMTVNQHQLSELERHLDAFKEIRDRAVEALPSIKEQIDASVAGMENAAQLMTKGMEESVSSFNTNLGGSLERLVDGVKQSSESMKTGVEESLGSMKTTVTETADKVAEAITTSTREFEDKTHAVNASLQTTSDAVSTTSEQTKQMFNDMLEDINSDLRNLVADLKQGNSDLVTSFKDAGTQITNDLSGAKDEIVAAMSQLVQQFQSDIKTVLEKQDSETRRILEGVSRSADEALANTAESVTKQAKALDDATSHQVNTVMSSMGSALATITQQFSNDYKGLVDEMQRITRAHRN
ncbi:MAG: hypothetical protein HWE20_04285 [Gammaproteobacteria bacterium]|nr:hypothetical protein [Gammaproteobacteria bacterium]